MNCDVVVVGAGNSGLVSAITAAEEGANVILVEKLGVTGGSAIFSSGMYFAVDSKYVEENAPDVNDNYDDALAFVMSIHDQSGLGTLNKEKMEKVLAQTGDTIDYLVSLGMTGEAKTWTETYGQWPIVQWTGKGAGMAASFTSIAQEAGVTILLNCPATELIQSDDGQITGVQCDYDGAPLTINSSKVILACGGFAQNEEMMSQYIADWTPMKMNNAASVGDTGDGIVMAQAVGAKLYDNYALMASTAPGTCTVDASFKANMTGTFSHTTKMAFNAEGLRYTNEKPAMSILAANAMLTDSSDAYYYLFDGSDEEILADLKTGMDMGEVYYGDTIDELAEALGINADTLQNTFDRYQGFCENGIDEDFGKDADALIAYSEDNGFYAVRYYPTLMGTYGGIATDDSFHVLNQDGAIIDNLFAVGEMTNRDFYNEIYVGSTSLGFGAVMGRMAALTAVEELSSSK
jgi:fumarate reductase flavoprotein subunit